MIGPGTLKILHSATLICAVCLAGLPATTCVAQDDQPQRPNVIIFLMDDMGYGDLHALNPEGCGIPTPHLDQLVADGVVFRHAHSPAAMCSPSRYSLLTGNYCFRGRRTTGTWDVFEPGQILQGQRTIADMLRGHGYSTAFFGKYHLGGEFYRKEGSLADSFGEADLTLPFSNGPLDHGFDESWTLPSGIQASPAAFFKNDRLARWDNAERKYEYEPKFTYFQSDEKARECFVARTWLRDENAWIMDNWNVESVGPLLMNRALHYIDKHNQRFGNSRPFFMHYCSQAGHAPYAPPVSFNASEPMNTEDVSVEGAIAVRGQAITNRTDMIVEGDVAIGLLINKLRQLDLLDNTLIIFTSENGVAKGRNSHWDNPVFNDRLDGPYGGNRIEVSAEGARKHVNGQGIGVGGQPLRGKKGQVYEGGHRVPLVFRWGASIPGGRTIDSQIIGLNDVYRTVAHLVGAEVAADAALDSVDFSAVLLNADLPAELVRDELFVLSNRPSEDPTSPADGKAWAAYYCESGGDNFQLWKSVIVTSMDADDRIKSSRPKELYDLTADPGELAQVDHPGMQELIHQRFTAVLQSARTTESARARSSR
ncbi:MAG: sulfatase-like hydrolase/transferase [Pirellulaceae bacterium]